MQLHLTSGKTFPSLLGLLVVGLAFWVYLSDQPLVSGFRERLEWIGYDLRMRAMVPRKVEPDPRVVIVDLDERSLQQEGHWPWARTRVGELVRRLLDGGAAVVGFDITFPEAERNPAMTVLSGLDPAVAERTPGLVEGLAAVADQLDGNRHLAEQLAGGPVVLGFLLDSQDNAPSGVLPPPLLDIPPETRDRLLLRRYQTFTGNIPILQEATGSAGFFMVEPDDDGVIRRAALVARHGDEIYPSLALELMRHYNGATNPRFDLVEVAGSLEMDGISFDGMESIPTDRRGQVIIPFRGPRGSFPYLSATDVLHGEFDPAVVRDAIVLIGTTAAGLFDLRATPLDAIYPGVEVHANLITALLDESFPIVTAWARGTDMAMILGVGILFALLFPHLRPTWLLTLLVLVMGGYLALNIWLWQAERVLLSLALPLITLFLLAVLNMAWGYFRETHGRNLLKNIFGQYIPPALVDEMNRRPGASLGFDGESREMTVLFCDIRGFTTISESLAANELKKLLNYFFTPMTRTIFEHNGTIDKYVGDMIMAFWGAPLANPNHRGDAIRTALAMLRKVEEMKEEIAARHWPPVQIGVGLNSGMMNVGDMGSEFRRAYTVIGDAVNLGSRLEGLSKFYGVKLVVSEFTRAGQEDAFRFRKLDRVKVKGKHEAVDIFEPVCETKEADATLLAELAALDAALESYYRQAWDPAEGAFTDLYGQFPERKLYPLYLERIAHLREEPPPADWDGSYTHTSK